MPSDFDAELVLGKIFERAIETKMKVGQMYNQFAQMFSHVPEANDFWKKMNLNLVAHADWLKETKESLSKEEVLSLPEVDLVLKIHSIRNLFDRSSRKEVGNLHDAYEIANEIESSDINDLFKILTNEFIYSDRKREFILDAIEKHRAQIQIFPEKFSGGMKEIKANGAIE